MARLNLLCVAGRDRRYASAGWEVRHSSVNREVSVINSQRFAREGGLFILGPEPGFSPTQTDGSAVISTVGPFSVVTRDFASVQLFILSDKQRFFFFLLFFFCKLRFCLMWPMMSVFPRRTLHLSGLSN